MNWVGKGARYDFGLGPSVSPLSRRRYACFFVTEEDRSMGHLFSCRAFGRWIRDGFRQRTRSYRWENFPIHCAAQAVVIFMLVHYHILHGSMPEPIFLIGALLFSFLFWQVPTGDFRRNQLFLATQTLIACLGFFREFLFIYLFLLLVGQAVFLFRIGPALVWIGLYLAIALWGTFFQHAEAPLPPAVRAILLAVGFIFSGILSNRIAYERSVKREVERLLTEISEAHARLREYIGQSRFLVVVEEHNRLARELHDSLGHRLTVAIVQVEGANRVMEKDQRQAGAMLKTVHSQLKAGLDELRDTIQALSTPEVNASNLTPVLRRYTSRFSRETGISLHVQLTDVPDFLSESDCLTVYRAIQEWLMHMQNHAHPVNIWMDLDVTDDSLVLTMRHDGEEFDLSTGYGYGLPGMQERAFQLEGTLRVTRLALGGGDMVTFTLPIGGRRSGRGHGGIAGNQSHI